MKDGRIILLDEEQLREHLDKRIVESVGVVGTP